MKDQICYSKINLGADSDPLGVTRYFALQEILQYFLGKWALSQKIWHPPIMQYYRHLLPKI